MCMIRAWFRNLNDYQHFSFRFLTVSKLNVPAGLAGVFKARTPHFLNAEPKASSPRPYTYLWLVGNGRMVVIGGRIVPHSSIPY